MRTYIIKRVLLMIPTLFGIVLVSFVAMNLMPGHPGGSQLSADFSSQVRSERTQESYLIFREQFNLDKPVLLNWRFALKEEDISRLLKIRAGLLKGKAGENIKAQQWLEDYGQHAVPHLISLVKNPKGKNAAEDEAIRDSAVYFLRLNARRPLIRPFDPKPTTKLQEMNRAIDAENGTVRDWRYNLEDPPERKQAMQAKWLDWFEQHKERWTFSEMDKVRIFFLETRFASYMSNVARLDFGVSNLTKERVVKTMMSKLKYSIALSVGSILIAYFFSVLIGIYSAAKRNTLPDTTLTIVIFMMYSLPEFFIGTLLLVYLTDAAPTEALRVFPVGGWIETGAEAWTTPHQLRDIMWHLVLPMITLTIPSFALLSRFMRVGLLDVLSSDYIRTARAKGLSGYVVLFKHAVRNGLLPILTLMAGLLPAILGGDVVVETIFNIPGLGKWLIDSIRVRDYNVIMAELIFTSVLTLVGILLSDLSYALVDPRITFD